MKKKTLSIVDIAKQLNISKSTVSFILNGKAKERRISDELRDRVLQFVSEVGYTPNQLARSFRTGKSHIIGLMVEDISNPFFGNLARFIEEKAYASGYKIIYCSTENNVSKARDQIQMFRNQHVDGYVITPTENLEEDVKGLINEGKPVILFDRHFPGIETDYVVIDNYTGVYEATRHLLTLGCRKVAFITTYSLQSQMKDRLYGYEKAMDEAGLNHYVKEIGYHDDTDNIFQHLYEFISKKQIDGIIFATNYLATTGLKVIRKLGLSIPKDIAVVSFDDHVLFELHIPGITAISQPVEEMSEQVMNILLSKLNKPDYKKKEMQAVVLAPKMIIRESSMLPQEPEKVVHPD